jgi:hypothetical protein
VTCRMLSRASTSAWAVCVKTEVTRAEIISAQHTAPCCLAGARQCRRGLHPPPRAAGCGASCRTRWRGSLLRGMRARACGDGVRGA